MVLLNGFRMQNKSITELRGIAQSMGCVWGFADDAPTLIQKIELKRDLTVPPAKPVEIPLPPDQRLRSRPPSKVSDEQLILNLLKPYIDRGLRITFSEDGQSWEMMFNKKTDTGTMRQPPVNVLRCAERLAR